MLNLQRHNLDDLEAQFTKEEIKRAIHLLLAKKVPGSDGFTRIFFKECWETIKQDVMNAANVFYLLRTDNLSLLNSANIILLPKKEEANSISDFRPISLIHSFITILAKALAMWLAPHMETIVSRHQSTFIKK